MHLSLSKHRRPPNYPILLPRSPARRHHPQLKVVVTVLWGKAKYDGGRLGKHPPAKTRLAGISRISKTQLEEIYPLVLEESDAATGRLALDGSTSVIKSDPVALLD